MRADASVLAPEKINHRLTGQAKRGTIVMIHGLGSRLQTFDKTAERLAKDYSVLVIDQRGHGKTPYENENFTPEILAQDLAAKMDQLGIASAFILGHSLGARTAAAFAGLYPTRTRALILEDMEMQARPRAELALFLDNLELARGLPSEFASEAEALAALTPIYGEEAEHIIKRGTKDKAGHVRLRTHPHPHLLYRLHGGLAELRPALQAYGGPILVIKGEKSAAISEMGAKIYREEFPDLEFIEVPKARHTVHGRPITFTKVLRGFLDKH